jgi:hypothetical protein
MADFMILSEILRLIVQTSVRFAILHRCASTLDPRLLNSFNHLLKTNPGVVEPINNINEALNRFLRHADFGIGQFGVNPLFLIR